MKNVRVVQWAAGVVGVIIIGLTGQLWIAVPLIGCIVALNVVIDSLEK